MEEINGDNFIETIGSTEKDLEEERATLAFKVFEDIYAFARDTW